MGGGAIIIVGAVALYLLTRGSARAASPSAAAAPQSSRGTPIPAADVAAAIRSAEADMAADIPRGAAIYARDRGFLEGRFLPGELIAVIAGRESGGRADARSDDGEVGYLQLYPAEVREAGGGDPTDPADSVRLRDVLWTKYGSAIGGADREAQILAAIYSQSIGPGGARHVRSQVGSLDPDVVAEYLARAAAGSATLTRAPGARAEPRTWARRVARGALRAAYSRAQGWT
jgi:hypothetical protein